MKSEFKVAIHAASRAPTAQAWERAGVIETFVIRAHHLRECPFRRDCEGASGGRVRSSGRNARKAYECASVNEGALMREHKSAAATTKKIKDESSLDVPAHDKNGACSLVEPLQRAPLHERSSCSRRARGSETARGRAATAAQAPPPTLTRSLSCKHRRHVHTGK